MLQIGAWSLRRVWLCTSILRKLPRLVHDLHAHDFCALGTLARHQDSSSSTVGLGSGAVTSAYAAHHGIDEACRACGLVSRERASHHAARAVGHAMRLVVARGRASHLVCHDDGIQLAPLSVRSTGSLRVRGGAGEPTASALRMRGGADESTVGDLELASEFSGVFCELGDAIRVIAQNEAVSKDSEKGNGGKANAEKYWAQAIGHMDVMLSSAARDVQSTASGTIAVLADNSLEAKEQICNAAGMIQKLVNMMRNGELEAIGAMEVLTKDHVGACNQAREAGAVPLLVGFVTNSMRLTGDGQVASGGAAGERPEAPSALAAEHPASTPWQCAGSGAESSSPLVASTAPTAPTGVPVARKAQVVATLRNIATANEENRTAITRENVIPQLVHIMTKSPTDEAQAARSERIKLAEDTRKLAESAGQMLFTLICEGTKEVSVAEGLCDA